MTDAQIVEAITDQLLPPPPPHEVRQFSHDPAWEGWENGYTAEFELAVHPNEVFELIYNPSQTDWRWSVTYYPDLKAVVDADAEPWATLTEEQFREILLSPEPPRHLFPKYNKETTDG